MALPGPGWHLGPVLLALVALVLLGGCATGYLRSTSGPRQPVAEAAGGAGGFPGWEADTSLEGSPLAPPTCGDVAAPPGWPDLSSSDEELLAPMLSCSPAQFVEVQRGVDMPRLVETLEDWSAVRLGALGPVRDDAAYALNRKRASFLVEVTRERGPAEGEVFALFLLHSAFGDELKQVLLLLAGDKRLGETLGRMGAAREELKRRGLKLSDYEDRPERPLADGLRGAGSALVEVFTPHEARNARATKFSAQREQLPPPYQRALDEVERAERLRSFSPGNVALGSFDALTFGIPLGFYNLAAGTGHGLYSLSQGQYEQAARELTPVALLVAVYAGGKGVRSLSEARGATGSGTRGMRQLQGPEPRWRELKEVARQLEARLGMDGLRELARDIQASREAGRFVAVGGVDAALALREARGDVAKAQVWLSQAKPQRTGPTATRSGAGKNPGGVASLVDEQAGLTREVVEARLVQVELESPGPRLSRDVAVLEKQRPSRDAPLPGAQGHPLWSEYVAYYEKRVAELKQGKAAKGPLPWDAYERMRGWFARGLAFERLMVELLRADAALPRALRRFLGDFDRPRIETYVGVWKPESGLRFADVLVIEQQPPPPGRPPRVETFSFKSRNLSLLGEEALTAQMTADASEALGYYGETLDIRRPSLKPLLRESSKVPVQRVRLIYEGGALKPMKVDDLKAAMSGAQDKVKGVEVLFQ
ncbi:hypothetical protein [Archangium sp.]|uniref:hypothetical protein n=1 Tax=Archangium sp. TaxID=1872627 RepID=UPI002D3417F7|nr:hypothetical protein [Archangium sp.]HYO58757.1 hypothetical protein [Archangium sp.]